MPLRLTKPWQELSAEAVRRLPGQLGVFQLADISGAVVHIGYAGGRSPFGLRSAVTSEAAAGEWVMSGTFLGPSFGQAPTGKSFRVLGCCFMQIVDGRIVQHKDYWNPATFDRQVKIQPRNAARFEKPSPAVR